MNRKFKQSVNVGIFWYISECVYGATEFLDIETNTIVGKVDSHFEHWRVWETDGYLDGAPIDRKGHEYFDFPRGRILYDVIASQYIIYCDRILLSQIIREKIASFLNIDIKEVIWKPDLHYTTDRNAIRNLFDEDS